MDEKIIKADAAAAPAAISAGQKVVKKDVYLAGVEAREIVDAAGREAQAIADAAREEGYREGLSRWNQALEEAGKASERLAREHEEELVRLALRIAEKILGHEVQADPGAIAGIVEEALKSVRRERSLTIRVNPAHVEELRSRLDRLRDAAGGVRQIRIVANAEIQPGGCVVESELGTIDAQLETQLQCLEQILLRTPKS
jgi:flagellar biosynthesis/type III secretory pathway protein FliH